MSAVVVQLHLSDRVPKAKVKALAFGPHLG